MSKDGKGASRKPHKYHYELVGIFHPKHCVCGEHGKIYYVYTAKKACMKKVRELNLLARSGDDALPT